MPCYEYFYLRVFFQCYLLACLFLAFLPCHASLRNFRVHPMHVIFLCIAKLFIVHLCDLVDVPKFYEEACDCPDCIPTCCQGKWHIKIPSILTMHYSGYFIAICMFRTYQICYAINLFSIISPTSGLVSYLTQQYSGKMLCKTCCLKMIILISK